MKDYSQNNEQRQILEYFGADKGTFLSIGENDGETLSNVRALSLMNWGGVCVEPATVAFSRLKGLYENRPDILCVNAAITTQDGPIDFWDCGAHLWKGDTSLLSTTRPETLERWKRSGEQFTKTTVRGITFSTLVKEIGLNIPPQDMSSPVEPDDAVFDFISIDAEGADYSILTQIPLSFVGCRMLCVETNGKDDQKFIDYAALHGMRLHRKCVENLIFVQ